jgi:uncharacterized protein (DUF1919 family)
MRVLEYCRKMPERAYEVSQLRNARFSIITNNCWGYEIYNQLGRAYNTPFVGLFLHSECFVKMLRADFPHRLGEIVQCEQSTHVREALHYPVGRLPSGAEVHFLHEKSWTEANEKWKRRSQRLLDEIQKGCPLFFKLCDRQGPSDELFKDFRALGFQNYVTISAAPSDGDGHIVASLIEAKTQSLLDGLSLYRRRYEYMNFAGWLRTGRLEKTPTSILLGLQSRLFHGIKDRVRFPATVSLTLGSGVHG